MFVVFYRLWHCFIGYGSNFEFHQNNFLGESVDVKSQLDMLFLLFAYHGTRWTELQEVAGTAEAVPILQKIVRATPDGAVRHQPQTAPLPL